MRLSVEVTPDVPNPANVGFISSLLGNHTEYQLFLLRVVDGTHVDLQLQGLGPDDRSQAVVDSIATTGAFCLLRRLRRARFRSLRRGP